MSPRRRPTPPSPSPRPARAADEAAPARPTRGRPPLSTEDVRERVAAYCQRYGVRVSADGLPPFPSGSRETVQHREWLTVYRAVRRLEARSATATGGAPRPSTSRAGSDPCPVCGRSLPPSAREIRLGARATPRVRLHGPCADLIERLKAAGFEAASRALALLWASRPQA